VGASLLLLAGIGLLALERHAHVHGHSDAHADAANEGMLSRVDKTGEIFLSCT
jgi:hypothetical protein